MIRDCFIQDIEHHFKPIKLIIMAKKHQSFLLFESALQKVYVACNALIKSAIVKLG